MVAGAQQALPAGSKVGGKFELTGLVGVGGSGAVYRAIAADGSVVAVKLLCNPGGVAYDAEQLGRFVRESRAAACVRHRNTTRVLDAGTDPATGIPFLVMEYLDGEDLDVLLGRVGVLSPIVAVRVVLQACRGLAAAHEAGLVHRDIKPSNLFLHRQQGGEVVVKVCDFGLAKWVVGGEELTRSGALLGTPLFAAPEQLVDARKVDPRSDVWALAMTLYKALSGRTAYDGIRTWPELLLAHRAQPVPPLQDAAPWVDPALAQVVHGALLIAPEARCPTALALAAALEPFAGDTDHLNTSMLQRPPESLLVSRAPRAAIPSTWDQAATSKVEVEGAARDARLGTTINGRWELVKVLGRGGMGIVYEARSPDGNRCALKVILRDDHARDSEAARRFVREGRALMGIDSPYVVRVLDVDADPVQRLPYLAMELLHGTDLAALLRQTGPLEPAPVVRVFTQVCHGLSAAHATGVVHRDIKPGNIFLHEAGGVLIPKICDFGVAKRSRTLDGDDTSTELTRTGGILGSPVYMSPEQARNAKGVDQRTDLWSLGIALWEALSGQRAWEGCSTVGELILAICTQELKPLTAAAPWVDPGLAAVVHKALRKDPSMRYLTAAELAEALEPFAAPEPFVPVGGLVPAAAAAAYAVQVVPGVPAHVSSTMAHASTLGARTGLTSSRRARRRLLVAGAVVVAGMGVAAAVVPWRLHAQRSDSVLVSAPSAPEAPGVASVVPALSAADVIADTPSGQPVHLSGPALSSAAPVPGPSVRAATPSPAPVARDAAVDLPAASAALSAPPKAAPASEPRPIDSW